MFAGSPAALAARGDRRTSRTGTPTRVASLGMEWGKRLAKWFGKSSVEEVAIPGVWAFVFWLFSTLGVGTAGIYFAEWITNHQLLAIMAICSIGVVLSAIRGSGSPPQALPPALKRILSEQERADQLLDAWANAPPNPDDFWSRAFRVELGNALINRSGGDGQRLWIDRSSLIFLKPGPEGLRLIRFELDLTQHYGSPDSRVTLGLRDLHDWRAGAMPLPQFGAIEFQSVSFDLSTYPDRSPVWVSGMATIQIRVADERDERTIKVHLPDQAVAVVSSVSKPNP